MKYKKYLFILLLIVFLGCNKVYAAGFFDIMPNKSANCYYLDSTTSAKNGSRLAVFWDFGFIQEHNPAGILNVLGEDVFTEVYLEVEDSNFSKEREYVINWYRPLIGGKKDNVTGLSYSHIYNSKSDANNGGKSCPPYLIVRYKGEAASIGVFAFENSSEANMFNNASNQVSNYRSLLLTSTTQENYYAALNKTMELKVPGIDIQNITCETLFGNKNDPESLANLIDGILQYVRIIVPILIIGLGSVDLAKAAISSKEDEMKKAQQKFVKRIIAGVAVFLSPIIVDLIMKLADITWEGLGYTTCNF